MVRVRTRGSTHTHLAEDEEPATEEEAEAEAEGTEAEVAEEQFATALYEHTAEEEGELPFSEGDVVTVLSTEDADWWRGRNSDGAEGVFPSNYVKL